MNIAAFILAVIYWSVWLVTAVLLFLISCYLYWKTTKEKRQIDLVPGFKDWPIAGDLLHINTAPVAFFEHVAALLEENRWRGIMKIKVMEKAWIFLYSSCEVEKLLSSPTHINKSGDYQPLHPWLGMGLLTSTGEAWRARRHMLTPSFHFSILKDFLETINEHAVHLADKLERESCDQTIDICQPITLSTLDIICCTAMGVEMNTLDDGHSDYVNALYLIKVLSDERSRIPFYAYDFIYNLTPTGRRHNKAIDLVHQFAYKVIQERRELREAGECAPANKRRPFLDLLLECKDGEGNHLTDKEIREEVDTFMFEGHDTTSSGIAFTIYLLAVHVDAQRQCQAEIDEVLGSSESITSSDLSKMTYLERCIKESLRIFPPVPFFARDIESEATFGGYTLPKGTTINVAVSSLHRDPEVFPDPERFDPSRFTPENCMKRSPFSYVPFSAGPRNCIGQKFAMMELKVVVAILLRRFNLQTHQTKDQLLIRPALVLQPGEDGIRVKLTLREPKHF